MASAITIWSEAIRYNVEGISVSIELKKWRFIALVWDELFEACLGKYSG